MSKTQQEIGMQVDAWIDEEELPSRASFRPERSANEAYKGIVDPDTGECLLEPMDVDEIEAYREHLHWFMTRDYHLIMSLPAQEEDSFNCFRVPYEPDGDLTLSFPFGSGDYARLHPDNFNKQAYRIKKIYERVKDLATTHAAISDKAGKESIMERYISLVEKEFRDQAIMYREAYMQNPQWVDKQECFRRIRQLNTHIRTCKEIWQKHSESGA